MVLAAMKMLRWSIIVFGVLGLCLAVGGLFLDLPHNPATAFLLIAVGLSFLKSHVEKRRRGTGAES